MISSQVRLFPAAFETSFRGVLRLLAASRASWVKLWHTERKLSDQQ